MGAIALTDLVKTTLGPKGMVCMYFYPNSYTHSAFLYPPPPPPILFLAYRVQDKILQSQSRDGNLMVTNDGATILKSIYLDNAAAKILVGIQIFRLQLSVEKRSVDYKDISKTQDDEVGDGTTSVCVLAGELLREGEKLIHQKIHPQTIIAGMRTNCTGVLTMH